ncbi:MAG: DEAD/DEAH box helicase [Gammaproteobacteria bacterium]|nr:DEAD/DEAH box helicase [Gammaproteobacteria bacterium]
MADHHEHLDESGIDGYAALAPAEKLVAQIYGVIAPQPVGVKRAQRIASQAGNPLTEKRLNEADIRSANSKLIAAGIAMRPEVAGNVGVRATPHWTVDLTRHALADGRLQNILAAYEATRSGYGAEPSRYHILCRCFLVSGEFDQLERLTGGDVPAHVWRLFAEPLAIHILQTLPERYRDPALAGCLRHVIDTAADPEPVFRCWQRLTGRPKRHAADVAFIRILQGRFDEAEAVYANLPADARESRAARTGLASTRALVALLRGDSLAARREIDAALAAEKAGTRKRNVFPDHAAFALSLLALVRLDTPESRTMLSQLLRVADRHGIQHGAEAALVADAARAAAGHGMYGRVSTGSGLDTLYDGFRDCWTGSTYRNLPGWLERLNAYHERADANGYKWVAAECAATLRRLAELRDADPDETLGAALDELLGTDPDELLRADLGELLGPELDELRGADPDELHGPNPDDLLGAAPGDLPDPAPAHAELGTRTLTVLVEPVAEWERSLKALEQLAYDASRKERQKRAAASPAEKRLAWEVVDNGYEVSLSPREQRRNKKGAWSKGRRVALKRLETLDFLRDEDLAAAAAVTVRRCWNSVEHVLDGGRGLHALAGHPHLFNENGEPVDVVRREPELHIEEGADGNALVYVEPHGWDSEGAYSVLFASDNRIEVTRFTNDHRRLFNVVPPDGLLIPSHGKARLLEAVSALVSQVRVQSAAGPVAGAPEVDADPEPWVRLEPFEAGLSAALMVEPIEGSGICFEAGEGGATVFASRDGERIQAHRDLARERSALTRLVAGCPRLASEPTEYLPLIIPEPVECLELLEQLDAAGARCKWPRGQPFRIVARHSTPSLSITVKPAEEWFQASGELAVDDDTVLDLRRLFALLEANPATRFLELGPGEFLALTRTFRRQLDDLASLSVPAKKGSVRLHTLAAASLDELFDEADLADDRGWLKVREKLDSVRAFEPEVPSTLQAELRPYQVDGYRWLARLSRLRAGACLADDMGLGKTVQALAVLLDRAPGGPALVVAPTSVVANWVDEARRFAPTLNVRRYTGTVAERARLLDEPAPFDLYLTTYGVMQNDIEQLAGVTWHSAVLDEAQAIKNPATRRARAARQLSADFRAVTTGTPIQNNLMDLHSLFSFLNPGLLGSQEKFRANFGEPVERDGDEAARTRLRRIISPFVLRRLKTEVLDDLPERTEITLHVALSPEEATLYEALRQRAVEELEAAREEAQDAGEGERFQLFAHLTRLRLACCNPRLVLDRGVTAPESSKLKTFAETLDELLANRHKVLVFSQFVMHLKLVRQYLEAENISFQYLDGSTPAKARSERIAAFQSGQGDVFLISLKAGGTGLNLTAADYVIHMDPWWNPAVEDQASDRAHRIGQTRPVTIYRLVTEGTIEEQIVQLHHQKRDLAHRLLEGADAAGRLSTEELLELLRQPLA